VKRKQTLYLLTRAAPVRQSGASLCGVKTAIKRTNQIIVAALCNRAQISSQLALVIQHDALFDKCRQHAPHSEVGIPTTLEEGRGPSIPGDRSAEGRGGKNRSIETRAGIRTSLFPIFCFARDFLFPGKRLTYLERRSAS
jgi:hypothetical protein